MSLAFYFDEHVPGAIVRGLRARGVDVLTAQEDGYGGRPDGAILDRASDLGRLLHTEDQDFLVEGHRRQAAGISFPGIVFARSRTISMGQRVAELELIAQLGDPAEFADRVVYLPL